MRRYRLDVGDKEFSIDVHELAADRFEVVVGGETYDVTLASDEDLPEATITPGFAPAPGAGSTAGAAATNAPSGGGGGTASGTAGGTARPPAAKVVARARSATAAPVPRRPAGGGPGTLSAPMPGVILDIAVKAGDTVVRGQEIAVLDAMKMHNSIKSPRAGTVHEVCASVGQAVGHGDPIIRFEEG